MGNEMTETPEIKRLLIVSNRLPVTAKVESGKLEFHSSAGGLVTGIGSYLESSGKIESRWIGWPGVDVPEKHETEVRAHLSREHQAVPVFIDGKTMTSFYEGFCNETLWPLFHYFPTYASFRDRYWRDYRRVNQMFCDAVVKSVRPGDVIWVHDYHLLLLPHMLKERLPDTPVGFFLHIPFPSFEIFRMLPARWRDVILNGMLGADLVGFHTNEYANYFLRCVLRLLGYEHTLGRIIARDHLVEVDAFPMGIDYGRFEQTAATPENQKLRDTLKDHFDDRKMIVSVDRLDYSKGIGQRLRGYEHFLRTRPQWRKKVVLVLVLVPSREGVLEYQKMKRQIDEAIGRINGKYGSPDWTPISYQYTSLAFENLVAYYSAADVALVTPLRDGMNLVAKEYVASRVDGQGVLILSEMAGAARELGEAVTINPLTHEEIAQSLETALEMPADEQVRRMRSMQDRLRRRDVQSWAAGFLGRLTTVRQEQSRVIRGIISAEERKRLVVRYRSAERRLLLLDYDGTLAPFTRRPDAARPTREVLDLLGRIAREDGTDLVLVSGRPREVMTEWFTDPELNIVAEQGAWVKRAGTNEWKLHRPLSSSWKQHVLPRMRNASDRLPGTFVEEKDFSLVWHYRQADPEMALIRAQELTDGLVQFTSNMDLLVVPGHRTVEVRDAAMSKANAPLEFMDGHDFVLAVGDDTTDEDMFRALPVSAYTIRVGLVGTHARFNITGHEDVLELLERLAQRESNPAPDKPSEQPIT